MLSIEIQDEPISIAFTIEIKDLSITEVLVCPAKSSYVSLFSVS